MEGLLVFELCSMISGALFVAKAKHILDRVTNALKLWLHQSPCLPLNDHEHF